MEKSYSSAQGPVRVLKGVSFSLRPGEFVAIMGASGSGKSTLLHLLAGLTGVDSGRICIGGCELSSPHLSDKALTEFRRRRMGIIFQSYNLIPTLSVEENVLLPLKLEKKVSVEERAWAHLLLETLKLKERMSFLPEALSGGEQQRVAIARALVTKPALILADEPTGNLDSMTSREICAQLRELCVQQKRTILLVTHESSAAFCADKTWVLKDGQLVAQWDNSDFSSEKELVEAYISLNQ